MNSKSHFVINKPSGCKVHIHTIMIILLLSKQHYHEKITTSAACMWRSNSVAWIYSNDIVFDARQTGTKHRLAIVAVHRARWYYFSTSPFFSITRIGNVFRCPDVIYLKCDVFGWWWLRWWWWWYLEVTCVRASRTIDDLTAFPSSHCCTVYVICFFLLFAGWHADVDFSRAGHKAYRVFTRCTGCMCGK